MQMAKNLQQSSSTSNGNNNNSSSSKDGSKTSGGVKKRTRTRQASGNTATSSSGRILSRNSSTTSLSGTNILNPPSNDTNDFTIMSSLTNDASLNSFDSTQSSLVVSIHSILYLDTTLYILILIVKGSNKVFESNE